MLVTSIVALENVVATGSFDRTIKVLDANSRKECRTLTWHNDAVNSLIAVGDGTMWSSSLNGQICHWTIDTGALLSPRDFRLRSRSGRENTIKSMRLARNLLWCTTGTSLVALSPAQLDVVLRLPEKTLPSPRRMPAPDKSTQSSPTRDRSLSQPVAPEPDALDLPDVFDSEPEPAPRRQSMSGLRPRPTSSIVFPPGCRPRVPRLPFNPTPPAFSRPLVLQSFASESPLSTITPAPSLAPYTSSSTPTLSTIISGSSMSSRAPPTPTTTTTTSLTLAASPPLSNPPSGLPSPRSSTSTFPSAAPSRLIEPVRFDCGGDAAARTPPRHVNRQTSTAARIHLLTEGLNDEIWTAAENSSFVSVWSTTENRQLSEWMLDNPDLNKPKGVCCLILARDAIWAGLQRGSVYVWDALTHLPLLEIQYHQEAVRALLPISRHLVCSGSTDADKPLVLWRTFAPGRLPHQQVSGHFVDTVTLGQPASLRLIDRFGCVLSLTNEFDNEVDDDLGTSVPHDMLRRVQARQRASREREAIWTELLALPTIDEMRWRELLLHGLPDVEGQRLRKAAWLQLVDKHVGHIRRANPDFYTKNRNDQSCEQIELDLLRTMPLNQYFSSTDASGINKLRRVLAALSCYSAETSYCQGFNFLAALALLFLTEEDAFWALVAVVTVLMPKGYYTAPMLAARADQRVIRDLIRERLPKLDVFLKDVDVCMQTFQWFFTIFVEPAPTALSVRVWDLFLLDGNIVLHRFAFALFQQFEERIMQIQDRIELHMYVKNLLRNVTDIDLLCDLAAQVDLPDLEERRVRAIELIRKEDQDADADCAMRRRSRSSATARTDTPSDHAGGPTPRPTTTTPRPPTTSPPPSTPQPVSFTPQPSGGSEGKDESELDVERKRSDSGAVGGASVSEAGRVSDHMFESLSPPHNFTNTSATAAHCSTPARKHAPAPSLATTLAFSPAITAGFGPAPAPAPAPAPELRVTAARPISPETHTSGSGGSGGSGQEGLSVSRADTTLTSGNRTIVDSAFDEKDHIDIPQRHGRQPGSIILSSSGPTPGRAGYGLAGSVGTVMDAGARRAPSDAVSLASDVTATDHSTSDGPFQLDEDYFS